jgi:hypothetical protein
MERRPIPGFPGYEITEDGRVFCWLPRNRNANPLKVARELKLPVLNNGYKTVNLMQDGKRYAKYVHRLVLETFVGPSGPGQEACHNDGNRLNNHISNLRWDSRAGNQSDRKLHGTDNAGSKHGRSKLTEPEVMQIRALYKTGGFTQTQLAKQFGVSTPVICLIVNRRKWTHI